MRSSKQYLIRLGGVAVSILLPLGAAACASDDEAGGSEAVPSSPGGVMPTTTATAPPGPSVVDASLPETVPAPATGVADTSTTEPATITTSLLDGLLARNLGPADADTHARQEQLIAECMREEGFQYTPMPYRPPTSDAEMQRISREVYGGYGVVASLIGRVTITGADATPSALPPPPPAPSGGQDSDPNADYVAALSPADRVAYSITLEGYDSSAPPSTAASAPTNDVQDRSCRGRASVVVSGVNPWTIPDVRDRLSEAFTTIDADPRVRAAIADWTDCVQAVFDDVGPEAIRLVSLSQYVQREVDAALGIQTTQSGESGTQIGEARPITADEYQRLADLELRAFDTDIPCRLQAGIEAARNEVENEIAEALIAEFPELAID